MKNYFLILSIFLTNLFGGIYGIGEYISNTHQNVEKETCYPGNGYDTGDNWKLADWNGDLNGGNYNVIVMIMSASW